MNNLWGGPTRSPTSRHGNHNEVIKAQQSTPGNKNKEVQMLMEEQ